MLSSCYFTLVSFQPINLKPFAELSFCVIAKTDCIQLNQFPFRADTKSKTDYVCNTLLQEVHNYFETAFKAWNTGFLFQGLNETECDTIQYGSTNSCPTYQQIDYWTWRLGCKYKLVGLWCFDNYIIAIIIFFSS